MTMNLTSVQDTIGATGTASTRAQALADRLEQRAATRALDDASLDRAALASLYDEAP
jgi:hypothetical protein